MSYIEEGKSVKLTLETKQSFLKLEKPTKVKVTVENIDIKKLSALGAGIEMAAENGKNYFTFTVTAYEKFLIDGHLEIRIMYQSKDLKYEFHKFVLPVK